MARLLITGGAGFIGSHTCVVLLEAGHELVVLDSFANSSPVALDRVAELTGRPVQLVAGDVRDATLLNQLFADATTSGKPIDAVIHFAGLKAVGESVAEPMRYWDVNLCGSRTRLPQWMLTTAAPWCSAAPAPSTASRKRSRSLKSHLRLQSTPTPKPNWPLNSSVRLAAVVHGEWHHCATSTR